MDEKKQFKKAKKWSNSLKTDTLSVPFAEEILDKKLLTKLKKPKYETDKLFYKLLNLIDNKNIFHENKAPTRADYVKKNVILIVPHYIILMTPFSFYMLALENLNF